LGIIVERIFCLELPAAVLLAAGRWELLRDLRGFFRFKTDLSRGFPVTGF
jgi:hypothetical protein